MVSVICNPLESVSSSRAMTGRRPDRPRRGPQPMSDFDLQGFQHLGVRVRVEATDPAPVAGKAQRALLSLGGAKHHADVDELILYRIRNIPDQLKLALPALPTPPPFPSFSA